MGFASYYEDNLDARSESVRGRHRLPTVSEKKTKKTQRKKSMESQSTLERRPNFIHTPQSKQSPELSQQRALYNTRQDIRRREFQKTQHVPVTKIQSVTTEEIGRRIQCEIIRQSKLKE